MVTVLVGPLAGIVGVAWGLVAVQAGVVTTLAYVVWRQGVGPRIAHLASLG